MRSYWAELSFDEGCLPESGGPVLALAEEVLAFLEPQGVSRHPVQRPRQVLDRRFRRVVGIPLAASGTSAPSVRGLAARLRGLGHPVETCRVTDHQGRRP